MLQTFERFLRGFSGAREDSIDRLNPLVAQLLVEIASIAPADSVYVPWDTRGQLAARASAVGRSAYLETPAHSLIPDSVAILCDKPFEVHFSDPIRLPSAIDKGKPVKFDCAICFPPIGGRYELSVAQKDWFGRFPESTGLGSVLAIRHLLWQTAKRVVIAVPNSVLFSTGGEQQMREDLLGRGIVEAVIAMRFGLLTGTNIAFSILMLDLAAATSMFDLFAAMRIDSSRQSRRQGFS